MKKLIVLTILVMSGACAESLESVWQPQLTPTERHRLAEMKLLTTTTLSQLANIKQELDSLGEKDASYRAKIELNKQIVREIAKDFNDVQIDACENYARAIDAWVSDKPNKLALNEEAGYRMFQLIDVETVLKITDIYIEQAVLCSEIISLQTKGKELIAKAHRIRDESKEKMDLLYERAIEEQERAATQREIRNLRRSVDEIVSQLQSMSYY